MRQYLILLDEADEGGAFHFDRLASLVIECDNKMEEVAFP